MIQKIKKFIVLTAATFMMAVPAIAAPIAVSAACNTLQDSLNSGINDATGGSDTACGADTSGTDTTTIQTLAKKIINIFSLIIGVTAVIFIIYGGFRYITSGGDSGNVGNAKNTIIYALIGLIIVALAQFIVHYVLNTAINNVS